MQKVIEHWYRLPRAMMDSPFKIRVDEGLRGMG